MKLPALIAATALALNGAVFAAEHPADGDIHQPLHGGVVTASPAMDYELVAKPTVIRLYLRDHGKPAASIPASAKLTLLTGSDKQAVELKSAGDRLEATGQFNVGPGTKAVAVLVVDGKPATARFTVR